MYDAEIDPFLLNCPGRKGNPSFSQNEVQIVEPASESLVIQLLNCQAEHWRYHSPINPLAHPIERLRCHQTIEREYLDQTTEVNVGSRLT
jgi:hypothetical protein